MLICVRETKEALYNSIYTKIYKTQTKLWRQRQICDCWEGTEGGAVGTGRKGLITGTHGNSSPNTLHFCTM